MEDQAIQGIPQGPLNNALDELPTREETTKVIGQLQIGKAPDGISPEIFEDDGGAISEQLVSLFQFFWERREVAQDLKDANIIHLYRNKGEKAACTRRVLQTNCNIFY